MNPSSRHRARLERAESLLDALDDPAADPRAFAEVRELLDEVQQAAARPGFDWVWAHYLSALWHRLQARAQADVREIDVAIVELKLVTECWDAPDFRVELVNLLRFRYAVTGDRPHLDGCVQVLRGLVTEEFASEAQRGWIHSLLGRQLVEQFRRALDDDGTVEPVLLDEAEKLLDGSLDHFDEDAASRRADTVLGLARLHFLRVRTSLSRDREEDWEEAVALCESVQDPEAAVELARLWYWRFDESGEPFARTEALRWLDESEHSAELVHLRGELLLGLAREDRSELPRLIDFLTEAFAAEPVAVVGVQLVEAHWLACDAEAVVRVTGRLEAEVAELMRSHRAIALASLALRGRAAVAEAEALLLDVIADPDQMGWRKNSALALLVALRTGDATMPDVMGEVDADGVARHLLAWLREHEQPGWEWRCALAALHRQVVRDGDLASRKAALEETVAARAALAGADAPVTLELEFLLQQGMLTMAVSESTEDPRTAIAAAALLEEALGKVGEDHPLRSDVLGLYGSALSYTHMWSGSGPAPLGDATGALGVASGNADTPPHLRASYLIILAQAQMLTNMRERADLHGSAVELCRQAMNLVDEGSAEHTEAVKVLGMLLFQRFLEFGERHDLVTAVSHLRAVRDRGRVDQFEPMLRQAEAILHTGQIDRSTSRDELCEQLANLDAGSMSPVLLASSRLELATMLIAQAEDGDTEVLEPALEALTLVLEAVENGEVTHAAFSLDAVKAWALAAHRIGDHDRFLRGIRMLAAFRDDTGLPASDRASAGLSLSMFWAQRHDVTLDTGDLDEALRQYARVDLVALRGPDSTGLLDDLADSCWDLVARGYGQAAVRVGFDSLRLRANNVVLQAQEEHAVRQAADAAFRGQQVALRCAALGDLVRAVEAVEWGRGLVLHSATVTSGIGERLRAAGREELAAEWERGPAAADAWFAPSDVRRRVLSSLENDSRTLSPSIAEISDALQGLDATALVHLVPGQGEHSGRAWVTAAEGSVTEVLLPLLVDGPGSAVGRYLAADDEQRREQLPALCEWAWQVAVEPLLGHVPGDMPWFVLVPTGALGVVPWHAAGGDGRMALREAGFTYAVSARQLCDLARRPRQPVGASPVVVSDPVGTLVGVSYEAEFLHGLCPHGHFYGQAGPAVPVRGAGTPAEVLAESGASLLHLGCHARTGATPAQSVLELARAELSVGQMLRHAGGRPGGATGGLVVLAACESDLTASLHDEALTLAAAYVVAGASGVVGTKWKVDDIESALLMCVFYDFVLRKGMRPRDALRAVQLWALDADRAVPAGVARHLAERGRTAVLAEPRYWAAFAHQGW
ncbi:CHAT domain-containing protein [Lentzea sp. CA-135723]|uniref:CHAT domain-containing protein n=1 Tax=Lentzea sp. CA-135723 TaxID=3239950 RepID=UPI003D8CC4E8